MTRVATLPVIIALALACNAPEKKITPADSTAELTLAPRDTASPQLRDQPTTTGSASTSAPPAVSPESPSDKPAAKETVPRAVMAGASTASKPTPLRSEASENDGNAPVSTAAVISPAPVAVQEIRTGTTLAFRTLQRVCDGTAKVGDVIAARLDAPVYGSGGAVLDNTTASFRIASLGSTPADTQPTFTLSLVAVQVAGVETPVATTVALPQTERHTLPVKRATVGKGALLGALGGALFGRGVKGALAGAAAGTAGGAVVANATRGYELCVPEGATVNAVLTSPLRLDRP